MDGLNIDYAQLCVDTKWDNAIYCFGPLRSPENIVPNPNLYAQFSQGRRTPVSRLGRLAFPHTSIMAYISLQKYLAPGVSDRYRSSECMRVAQQKRSQIRDAERLVSVPTYECVLISKITVFSAHGAALADSPGKVTSQVYGTFIRKCLAGKSIGMLSKVCEVLYFVFDQVSRAPRHIAEHNSIILPSSSPCTGKGPVRWPSRPWYVPGTCSRRNWKCGEEYIISNVLPRTSCPATLRVVATGPAAELEVVNN
ncbi:hypothetical protein V8F20_002199 [Naviculisporaceae sp. PSN 640]